MKSYSCFLLAGLFGCMASFAQSTSNLHIVTSRENRMAGFHFNFTVNGTHYKLKAGECLDLKIRADSIHILMEDKRWVNPEPVNLHVTAEEHLYIQVLWGWMPGEKKKTRAIAQAICKACFDELKPNCRRELAQ